MVLMAFLRTLIDFWSSIPSCSESLRSKRRITPARPTTDGKPNEVSEKKSYDDTGKTRISSLKILFRIWTTQVAMP